MADGAARADQVLPDRRDGRPGGVRHRLGRGQDLAGRHDQRLHRGLHGPARHEGLVGEPGLLRQPGKDRGHPQAGRRRAVVRGPHAVGRRSTASRASAGITANAIDVVVETGDSGPITPIGINLPNDQNVREQHGSKSVSLSNVNEAYDRSTPPEFRREFSWTPEETARAEKWSSIAVRAVDQHARGDRACLRQDCGSAQGQSVRPR